MDTFEYAETLIPSETNEKPTVVLNMVNAYRLGGAWLRGAIAQEEQLCYRSTLPACLAKHTYPIPQTAAFYSPAVVIFRDLEKNVRPGKAKDWLLVAVMSSATIDEPDKKVKRGKEYYANPEEEATQEIVCRTILRVAAKEKHRNLVLGAIGRDAFYHPVEEAARIWAEVLGDVEFDGWFENVTFAVLCRGAPVKGEPSGNFNAFQAALQDLLVGKQGVKLEGKPSPKKKRAPGLAIDIDRAETDISRIRAGSRTPSGAKQRMRSTPRATSQSPRARPSERRRSSTRASTRASLTTSHERENALEVAWPPESERSNGAATRPNEEGG
jgi:uncharacterized protein (TIGR02452 family)